MQPTIYACMRVQAYSSMLLKEENAMRLYRETFDQTCFIAQNIIPGFFVNIIHD